MTQKERNPKPLLQRRLSFLDFLCREKSKILATEYLVRFPLPIFFIKRPFTDFLGRVLGIKSFVRIPKPWNYTPVITEFLWFLFRFNNLNQNISLAQVSWTKTSVLRHLIKRLHTWMKTLQRLERSSENFVVRCSLDKTDSIFVIHELTKT